MSHWRRSRAPIWRCVRQFYTTLIERHVIYCWRPQSSKILFLAGLCSAAAADTSSCLLSARPSGFSFGLFLSMVWHYFMFSLDPQIIHTHILQDAQTLIKQASGSVARFPYLGDVVDVHGALKEIFDGSSFNCEDCFEQGWERLLQKVSHNKTQL